MGKNLVKEQSKCPFTGAGTPPKHATGKGTTNRDWWPNGLNLKILSQHSSLVDPMDKKFNYSKEFKKLNFKALKKDLHKLNEKAIRNAPFKLVKSVLDSYRAQVITEEFWLSVRDNLNNIKEDIQKFASSTPL